MNVFLAFMFGVIGITIWEARGGPRWRPAAAVAVCAVVALAFSSLRFV